MHADCPALFPVPPVLLSFLLLLTAPQQPLLMRVRAGMRACVRACVCACLFVASVFACTAATAPTPVKCEPGMYSSGGAPFCNARVIDALNVSVHGQQIVPAFRWVHMHAFVCVYVCMCESQAYRHTDRHTDTQIQTGPFFPLAHVSCWRINELIMRLCCAVPPPPQLQRDAVHRVL